MIGWKPVSRNDPCKICGGPDNCTESDDGRFAYCGRVSEGSKKQNNGGQFLHPLDGQPEGIDWLLANPKQATVSPKSSVTPIRDWNKFAAVAFNHMNADIARKDLAELFGVTTRSLERLGIGWLGRTRGWSIPERDATGKVIGINRRLTNGEKRRERGGNAGLTYDPVGWLEWDVNSDVHLPEGASDTAVMLSMGFSAVGRPSNLGGVDLLGELLRSVPSDRRIIVVGENDRKSHNALPESRRQHHNPNCECCATCWPGKFGAVRTAEQLAAILMREISWMLPPDCAKDVRSWLNDQQRTDARAENGS